MMRDREINWHTYSSYASLSDFKYVSPHCEKTVTTINVPVPIDGGRR